LYFVNNKLVLGKDFIEAKLLFFSLDFIPELKISYICVFKAKTSSS